MKDPFLLYSTEEYAQIHNMPTIAFPKMLIMQASSYCNFDCLQCPRQTKVERRKVTGMGNGYLPVDLLAKAADEFKDEPSFLGVLFALYGEPLMNRNIAEMVRIVKAAGKKVQITTNACLLDEETIVRLCDAGIDKIKISFQGTTEKEYGFWRNNPHFDRVNANIMKLLQIREQRKAGLYVQIGTSVANDTDEEIESFVKKWRGVVDNVYYEPTGMLHIQDKDYVKGKTFRFQAVRRTEPCFDIFSRMAVLYNGNVPLCVDDEEHCLGNLYKSSIKEIWHGAAFEANRRRIISEGNVLPPCQFCYTAPRETVNPLQR